MCKRLWSLSYDCLLRCLRELGSPITTTSPASKYWGIDQSIRYSTSTAILSTTAGIVDTMTSLILLATGKYRVTVNEMQHKTDETRTDAYDLYQSATGAVLDNDTGMLTITSTQYDNLETLFFTVGGTTFGLTANGQIWPRSLNTAIGGTSGRIYLVVTDLGSKSGSGLDFIIGYTFLERFYSVYDTANQRVGLATTPFTTATTN